MKVPLQGPLNDAFWATRYVAHPAPQALPLVTLNHQLHGLSPSLDHLVGSKSCGAAAVVRGVKLWAVWVVRRRSALVVALAWGIHRRVVLAISGT